MSTQTNNKHTLKFFIMFLNLVPVHIFTGNATKCLPKEKHKNSTIKSQKTKADHSNTNLSV